ISGRRDRLPFFPHNSNEADALARQRLNQALRLATVADRSPCRVDTCRQCGLRDDAAMPDGGDEVLLADDALAVFNHIREKVKDLGLERYQARSAMQLATISIQSIIFEPVEQV